MSFAGLECPLYRPKKCFVTLLQSMESKEGNPSLDQFFETVGLFVGLLFIISMDGIPLMS